MRALAAGQDSRLAALEGGLAAVELRLLGARAPAAAHAAPAANALAAPGDPALTPANLAARPQLLHLRSRAAATHGHAAPAQAEVPGPGAMGAPAAGSSAQSAKAPRTTPGPARPAAAAAAATQGPTLAAGQPDPGRSGAGRAAPLGGPGPASTTAADAAASHGHAPLAGQPQPGRNSAALPSVPSGGPPVAASGALRRTGAQADGAATPISGPGAAGMAPRDTGAQAGSAAAGQAKRPREPIGDPVVAPTLSDMSGSIKRLRASNEAPPGTGSKLPATAAAGESERSPGKACNPGAHPNIGEPGTSAKRPDSTLTLGPAPSGAPGAAAAALRPPAPGQLTHAAGEAAAERPGAPTASGVPAFAAGAAVWAPVHLCATRLRAAPCSLVANGQAWAARAYASLSLKHVIGWCRATGAGGGTARHSIAGLSTPVSLLAARTAPARCPRAFQLRAAGREMRAVPGGHTFWCEEGGRSEGRRATTACAGAPARHPARQGAARAHRTAGRCGRALPVTCASSGRTCAARSIGHLVGAGHTISECVGVSGSWQACFSTHSASDTPNP